MIPVKQFLLADTTTATSNISEVQGTQWAAEVIKFGEALRRFDQAVNVNKDLVGSGDKTLTIPKSTSHLDIDVAKSAGEADLRDTTALSNLRGVSITFSASDFKQGAVTISKEIATTSRVDLVKQARYVIAQDLADDVDSAIATAFQDTTVTNVVYGGDATTAATLATGDVMTADVIADAMEKIEANNFEPKFLFVGTPQIKALRKDSQFVNASEYGSDKVVLKGEIGEYLGLTVIKTTNTPAYASGATDTNETPVTWGATGHCCIMVGTGPSNQPVAVTLAWKEMPSIGYEYDKKRNKHWVYYDQTFKCGMIQPGAVCLLKVTDA